MPVDSTTPTAAVTETPSASRAGFGGDVLRLATGTASAQLIGLLAAPLIARMFSPSAFGALAIFAAVAGTVSVVSCLRYETAIYLPEKDEEAANLAVLSLCLVTLISAITGLLTWMFADVFFRMAHAPELKGYAWLLPINVFVSGTWMILNSWNQRKRKFGRITILQVVTRVALVSSQIAAGLAGFVSGGVLIATTIFGAFVTITILGWQTMRDDWRLFISAFSWEAIRYVRKRYDRFPRFGLAATLLNSASFQLPVILLSGFFGMTVAGNYSFGFRVLRVPGMLIGANVNRAFFPRAAEAKHRGTLGESVELALQYLVTLSFFPCFLLALTGGALFVFALGPKWHEAGVYAQILSVWLFFWFISSPLNTVFAVLEEQALELQFQAVNIVTRLVSLVIGGLFGNARLALALFALCGVAVYGAYCLAVIRKSRASMVAVGRVTLAQAKMFVPAAAILLTMNFLRVAPIGITAVTALILAVYYWNLLRTDQTVRGVFKRFVRYLPFAADQDSTAKS
ncbi:MAG: oligosaccharide flippase family protein [Acidobacteriia bacterium]|nr:oligosaccharide flippase family protein [Terriglobia bacterium]